jgi:hydrogenase-4 membrane subunit HyfE
MKQEAAMAGLLEMETLIHTGGLMVVSLLQYLLYGTIVPTLMQAKKRTMDQKEMRTKDRRIILPLQMMIVAVVMVTVTALSLIPMISTRGQLMSAFHGSFAVHLRAIGSGIPFRKTLTTAMPWLKP